MLVPTFNALNASYVKDVPPPPWLPTPPTPPDVTPPTDFKPPPGMTPPTNLQGKTPPCPPPVIRQLVDQNDTLSGASGSYQKSYAMKVPNATIRVVGSVNFTSWQAQQIGASLRGPGKAWSASERGDQSTGLLVQPTPQDKTSFTYDSYKVENGQTPKPGDYTLTVSAQLPLSGNVRVQFYEALSCGGALS